MSGIVALLRHDGAPTDVGLLARMTESQRFRGPDGIGQWSEGPVGLGHTLHKATLEAEREVQPAAYAGKLFITADARIDAREDLCEALRGRGIDAKLDATDPDLILAAYAAWGEACVEHLLGDFSFALWDAQERKLFCAVDQLGVKPFFYANRDGLFAAANSLRCVRLHPGVRDDLDEIAVGDFLMFGHYLDRDRSIYQDIHRIAPGHTLVVKHGELRLKKYYDLPEPQEARFKSEAEVVEQFQTLLGKAVRDRLRTPRVAVSMSGGLDSPLVALTAKRELERMSLQHELHAFCLSCEHLMPDDEPGLASLAAKSIGIPITMATHADSQAFDWLDRVKAPEPFLGPTAGPWLRQVNALSAAYPVMLTGWDGDALLLASLPSHWRSRLASAQLSDLSREVAWYLRMRRGLPPVGLRNSIKRTRHMLSPRPLPGFIESGFRTRARLDDRWAHHLADRPRATPRGWTNHNFSFPSWGQVLQRQDAECLGCCIELRHPLMDLRVVGFTQRLSAVPWCVDKELLRRALRPLPEAVRRRPKAPLQRDPSAALVLARGLGAAASRWGDPRLHAFVNVRYLAAWLERMPVPGQLTDFLRVVGLGLWLVEANRE